MFMLIYASKAEEMRDLGVVALPWQVLRDSLTLL